MMATSKVGKHYGVYLNYLVENVGLNPENIHLVGHSLGAHVSGFAARELRQGTIGRITGTYNTFMYHKIYWLIINICRSRSGITRIWERNGFIRNSEI